MVNLIIKNNIGFLYLKVNTFVDITAPYKVVDHVGFDLIRDAQIILDEQAKQSAKPIIAVANSAKEVIDNVKSIGINFFGDLKWVFISIIAIVVLVLIAYSLTTLKTLKA